MTCATRSRERGTQKGRTRRTVLSSNDSTPVRRHNERLEMAEDRLACLPDGRCTEARGEKKPAHDSPHGMRARIRAMVCEVTSPAHWLSTACGRPKRRRSSDKLVT